MVPVLGIPSEVWILRQCAEFERIQPVILYWRLDERMPTPPAEFETHRFSTPFELPKTLVRRVARRVGLPAALRPNARQREDIRRTVRAARLDALHCHFAWTGLPVSLALRGDLPIVWQVHGRDVSAQMRDPAYRRAVAQVLPGVDHVVAVGRFQIERLKRLGLSAQHSVIPCGAPLEIFATREMPKRAPGQTLRFLTVGRLSAEKGVLETLSAFEIVGNQRPDVELAFVGDGPLREALTSRIEASPMRDRVRMLGLLAPAEVATRLSSSHVFLQHSLEVNGWVEGFGVTLTEAGAAGLPLIASRLGGIVDQVYHEENGLLFDPGDVATQAAHMLSLVDDEPRRARMGDAARRVARTFDSRLMTSKLEDVLLASLSARPSRRVEESR